MADPQQQVMPPPSDLDDWNAVAAYVRPEVPGGGDALLVRVQNFVNAVNSAVALKNAGWPPTS